MITSTTQIRKEETTMERWMKALVLFYSDSLAMKDSTLYLLHFVNPIVASCQVVAPPMLPRPQMGLFRLDYI